MKTEKRQDYPLCPYCKSQVVGFGPPDGDIKKATIYCSGSGCVGLSLSGHMNGYDILFTDLKN